MNKKLFTAVICVLIILAVVLPTTSLAAPPTNDDFDSAIVISGLPFTDNLDTSEATWATDDPADCTSNGSVWYAFTPATDMRIEANTFGSDYDTVLSVYTGTRGALSLVPGACNDDYNGLQSRVQFDAIGGTTYHFLIGFCCGSGGDGGGNLVFSVQEFEAPPPEANFGFYPDDPSAFDTIWFYDWSWDPADVGIDSQAWDFGDGATALGCCPSHRYASDGDYTVQLAIVTFDGRTASTYQTVQVRTHDIAITRVNAPRSAKSGQTRQITVEINNKRYPEMVEVQLYKSVPGGFEFVGGLIQQVPVRSSNRTTSFKFSYTFTSEDANIGKVTFKATAFLVNVRDALPADNEAIAPPTKVNP